MSDVFTVDSKGRPIIDKDPNALLDYIFDWTQYLAPIQDFITELEFLVDSTSGIVIDHFTSNSTGGTVWISGGTDGQVGTVTCRITTNAGRIDDRSIFLNITQR